jgi:hypothetical protein
MAAMAEQTPTIWEEAEHPRGCPYTTQRVRQSMATARIFFYLEQHIAMPPLRGITRKRELSGPDCF